MSDDKHTLTLRLERVFAQVWRFALFGLAVGISLIAYAELGRPHWPVVEGLIRELGTGFIVAAVAVLGYEYLRDVSGVVEAEHDFRGQIDLLRILRSHERLAGALVVPVQHAAAIRARSGTDKSHPYLLRDAACLDLLADLSDASIAPVARALDSLHDSVAHGRDLPGVAYRLLDPRMVAGKVLSLLLSTLGHGDHYKSVANVLFYKNTLMQMFESEAERACNRGVVIQRLFNVSLFEDEPPSDSLFAESRRIMQAHLDLQRKIEASHPGAYQIRFYGGALDDLVGVAFNPADAPELQALPRAYFGLFCKNAASSVLLFFATEPRRASGAMLALRDKQSDRTDAYFAKMWELAASAPNPFDAERFDPDWLAPTVARLKPD